MQAQTNLNEGYEWIIELDLEKFFDRINHDKLVFEKNKEKDEGANLAEWPRPCKRKDKENGSDNPRMGKLLLDSQSQKQDEGIRRTGKNESSNGNMETMEEAKDEKEASAKTMHITSQSLWIEPQPQSVLTGST